MSRSRNEKERLARRAEYQQEQRGFRPFIVPPREDSGAQEEQHTMLPDAEQADYREPVTFTPSESDPRNAMAAEYWQGEITVRGSGRSRFAEARWEHDPRDICARHGLSHPNALRRAQELLGRPSIGSAPCVRCGEDVSWMNLRYPGTTLPLATFGSRTRFMESVRSAWCEPCAAKCLARNSAHLASTASARALFAASCSATHAELRARFGARYIRDCPACPDGVLYLRQGKHPGSMFIACSSWPACDHREPIAHDKAAPMPDAAEIERVKAELAAAPKCPMCGAALRRRVGKRGPFAGCSAWPQCSYTESIPSAPPAVQGEDVIVGKFE